MLIGLHLIISNNLSSATSAWPSSTMPFSMTTIFTLQPTPLTNALVPCYHLAPHGKQPVLLHLIPWPSKLQNLITLSTKRNYWPSFMPYDDGIQTSWEITSSSTLTTTPWRTLWLKKTYPDISAGGQNSCRNSIVRSNTLMATKTPLLMPYHTPPSWTNLCTIHPHLRMSLPHSSQFLPTANV